MTLDGVSKIETALGIKLPSAYKTLVTNYPPELFQHAADFDLMDDPDRVIAMNREVRTSAFYGVRWPADYFAIGENGCGDYYCLDLSGQTGGVLFFDHEIRKFEERAPSVERWWPMIVKDYEES
jgi:SMI1 / KNR4 family (SUKH-1)